MAKYNEYSNQYAEELQKRNKGQPQYEAWIDAFYRTLLTQTSRDKF